MGWARISFIGSEFYSDSTSNYVRAITSSGADINASVMSQPILQIPICYNQNWIPTSMFWEFGMKQCGYLAMYAILPLMGVEGDSPSLPIRITLQFENLQLAAPTNVFGQGSLFRPYASGQSELTGQSLETNSSIVYYPRTNAFGNYEEGTEILRNVVGGDSPDAIIQTTEDSMDLGMLVRKPGICAYFQITSAMQPGDVIYSSPVTPILDGEYSRPATPLAYFSRWGSRWKGALKYKWMIAKNVFSTCKVAVVMVPVGHVYTPGSDYLAYNHHIFDLKEDSVLEWEMAFVSDHPTLRVPYLRVSTGNTYNFSSDTFGSRMYLILHTKLQTNATMQPNLNTALWVSGGTGFELFNINVPAYSAFTEYVLVIPAAPLGVGARITPSGPGVTQYFFIDAAYCIEGGAIAPGKYHLDRPITVRFSYDNVPPADWTGDTLTAYIETNGSTFVTNSPVLDIPQGMPFGALHAEPSDIREIMHPAPAELSGQSGISSAMHDKSQKDIPTIGTPHTLFSTPMRYEPLTSLLQILERPHAFPNSPVLSFANRTIESVDAFEMFSQCYAYTTGSVQWMVQGANLVANPNMYTDMTGRTISYQLGGVRTAQATNRFILADSPPMTDALVCMNVAGSMSSVVSDRRAVLTSVISIPEPNSTPVVYVRAGVGFSYHYWCGIPTPEQQGLTKIKNIPNVDTVTRTRDHLREQIRGLRERKTGFLGCFQTRELTGQMETSDSGKNWSNPKDLRRKSILKKIKTLVPPKTAHHVQSEVSGCEGENEGGDDESEDQYASPSSDCESSIRSRPIIPSATMVPKPFQAALQSFSDTAFELSENSGAMKNTFQEIGYDVRATREAVKSTTKKISATCEKTSRAIDESKSAFCSKIESLRKDIKSDGLFSFLFGKDNNHSKLIQIMLIDALECITIRSKIKWAGMLVKIGISLGLTNKLVNMIVSFFKSKSYDKTTNEVSLTESQQGDATGQALGEHLPMVCSVVSVLIMFGAFSMSGGTTMDKKKMSNMWDWAAERGRQVNSLDRGLESIFKFFDKINKWVVKAVLKFMPVDDTVFECLNEDKFLKLSRRLVADISPLLEVKQQVRIFADARLRKKVVDADKIYVEWWQMATDPEISRKHSSLTMRIERLLRELRLRIVSIIDTPSVRIDPYHISFFGGSGLGKSYLASVVAYVLGKSQNIPTEDLFYPRCPGMDFWDNYHCQEFVGIDDVDQIDDQDQAGELIQIKSNVPKVLPMAHLETKGAMFCSRGLITTTNVAYPEPKAIKCKLAYKRRRNVLIECIPVEGEQAFDLSHFRFVFRDPVDSTTPPLSRQYNFHELMVELAIRYSQYLKTQHRLVRAPCPDNVFKPLYIYENTDESRLKIFEICQDVLNRTVDERDQYMRDISEIETSWGSDEIKLPPAKEGVPTDFQQELKLVRKKKMTVEDEKAPTLDSSDEEIEWDDDEFELTGEAGESEEFQECIDNANRVIEHDIDPQVQNFLRGIPVPAGEDPLPTTITQDFADLVYVLSGGSFGTNYHELPDELPVCTADPMIEQATIEARDAFCKFRKICRETRTAMLKDYTDDYISKLVFCVKGYTYYYSTVATLQGKEKLYALMYLAYFSARISCLCLLMLGHNIKLGIASRVLRNINNRIAPDNLGTAIPLEGVRCAQEVALAPFCILSRIMWECSRYITNGLKYTFTTIYTAISEGTSPEYHSLMKIGLFLVGGFLIYQFVGSNSTLKKWWNGSKKVKGDPIVQAELLGESSECPNLTPQILTRQHIGMPNDGAPYKHFHQCEKCRLIYAHTHILTTRSPQFQLLCKRCTRAQQTLHDEAKKKGINDVEAPQVEGTEIPASDLEGEAVASSGGSMKEKFQKRIKLRGESENSEKQSVWKRFFRVYDEEKGVEDVKQAELTGNASDDPQTIQIVPSIKNNCASLHIGGRAVNVLFLGGRWAVTVYHVIALAQGKEMPYYLDWKGQKFPGILDTYVDTRPCPPVVLQGHKLPEDCVFVNFRMNKALPQFKDIRHHIPTSEELEIVDGSAGLLLQKSTTSSDFTHHPISRIQPIVDRTITTPSPKLQGYEGPRVRTAIAMAWEYHADTAAGACGSPLLVKNTGLTHKLAGFHIAALDGTSLAYGFPLYRELVDKMLEDQELIGQCELGDIKKDCSEWYECFPDDLPSTHTLQYVPKGRVLVLGKLDKKHEVNMPRKSDIVGSPYKDQIYIHTTEPAILSDMDPRSPGDIIQRGIDKFGKVVENCRPRKIMEKVIAHRVKKFERCRSEYTGPLRTLTEFEVINGIRGQKFIPPLRMDTSPGYPYVKIRPAGESGRSFLFEPLDSFREPGIPNLRPGPLLRRHLDEIWQGLYEGTIKYNYFVDTLKDERRSHHRLYKTRFFNVHNVAWLIVWKRLYGAVMAMKLTARFKIGSGLGMDMHGPEVTQMMNALHAVGDKFLMMDVAEWDGTRQADVLDDCMEANNRFMKLHDQDVENTRRREICKNAQAIRIHIVGSTVYMTFGGVPSGRGDTADINTDDHDTENYANWLELAQHYASLAPVGEEEHRLRFVSCDAKDEHTLEICVGDDGGGTVSDEAVTFYNDRNIECIFTFYGTKCTPPNKIEGAETKAYVPVEEFEFLKSTFRRDENFRTIWHMQMSPKVIRELTNWVTVHGNPYDLFYSNMEDALRFAYHHGRRFYEEFRTDVNTVLRKYRAPLLTKTFEESREEFLEKFGKFLLYPSS
jgi:hypothetical protein